MNPRVRAKDILLYTKSVIRCSLTRLFGKKAVGGSRMPVVVGIRARVWRGWGVTQWVSLPSAPPPVPCLRSHGHPLSLCSENSEIAEIPAHLQASITLCVM